MPQHIAHAEQDNQPCAHPQGGSPAHVLHRPSPHPSQEEEEYADEHIVKVHPQRVAVQIEPIADGWEKEHHPMHIPHLLHEMRHNIGGEKREQEPVGLVAERPTASPQQVPRQRLDGVVIAFEQEGQKCKIDNVAQQTAGDVGDEQPLRLVRHIHFRVARQRLVEVARLEEEEGHEEIRPRHHLAPRRLLRLAAELHDVERHHADDTDSAQNVEGMIALLHIFSTKIGNLTKAQTSRPVFHILL